MSGAHVGAREFVACPVCTDCTFAIGERPVFPMLSFGAVIECLPRVQHRMNLLWSKCLQLHDQQSGRASYGAADASPIEQWEKEQEELL